VSNSIQIRIQAGVEAYRNGARVVRLTPIDQAAAVPAVAAETLLLLVGIVDMRDLQPGDGEVDVQLGRLEELATNAGAPELVRAVAVYAESIGMVGGDVNIFLRIKRVA